MNTCPQCGGTFYCDEPGFSQHLHDCRLRAVKSSERPNKNSGELPRDHADGDPFAYERARIAHYSNSFEANKNRDEMMRITAAAKRRLARRELRRVQAAVNKPKLPDGYEFIEPGEVIPRYALVYVCRSLSGIRKWYPTRRSGEQVLLHQWYRYARRKIPTVSRTLSCTKLFTSGTFSLEAWRRRNEEVEAWAKRSQELEGVDIPLWIQVTRPEGAS